MVDYITATQCLEQLRSNGIVQFKMPYFSELVKNEKIPYHHKPGSPKKFFKYSEVKEALEEIKDPRRDPQRAANQEKREDNGLLDIAGSYPSEADMTEEEVDAKRKQLRALQQQAADLGVDDGEIAGDESVEKMQIKELNRAILQEELRIKRAKADDSEGLSISRDEVRRSTFAASRVVRDGLLGIPARLAARIAAETDPHKCRTMMEIEINRQLDNLVEVFREL